jgi:hypothetical protein
MEFTFREYSPNQLKEYINSRDIYNQYINELKILKREYAYRYGFQKSKGIEYFYKENSFTGKRVYKKMSKIEAEDIINTYRSKKKNFLLKHKETKDLLKRRESYNRFEGLNRVPKELVKIFQKINESELDKKIIVIGTNSLYVYETRCGVFIEQQFLSTTDIDLLNRRKKIVSLAIMERLQPKSIIEFLKSIDKTFTQNEQIPYAFSNKDQVTIEIINPHSKSIKFANSKADPFFDEIIKLEINKIEWLENSRLFESEIIATNGKMAKMTTIHPLDFAVYKIWLSIQKDRNPYKSRRDKMQSFLVTKLIQKYMPHINIIDELSNMKHMNLSAIELYRDNVLSSAVNEKDDSGNVLTAKRTFKI